MLRMSFPRAREVGKVPPFCFQARFSRHGGAEAFGLWRVCFPPCLVRPGRRLPVQGLSEGSLVDKVTVTRVMYVYYYRTYEKAVSGGGEREKGGHVLRDTTSRGLYGRVWPPPLVSGAGEGEVVSKKVGKEVRVAQG